MDEFTCYLLTLLEGDEDLVRVALQVQGAFDYPMEPEQRRALATYLSPAMRGARILKVERIEGVEDYRPFKQRDELAAALRRLIKKAECVDGDTTSEDGERAWRHLEIAIDEAKKVLKPYGLCPDDDTP